MSEEQGKQTSTVRSNPALRVVHIDMSEEHAEVSSGPGFVPEGFQFWPPESWKRRPQLAGQGMRRGGTYINHPTRGFHFFAGIPERCIPCLVPSTDRKQARASEWCQDRGPRSGAGAAQGVEPNLLRPAGASEGAPPACSRV